jgi:NADPH:quinone reductase-like Zn-dependent oxidoreductase
MKAFAIEMYKGDLTAREVPDPSPGPGDVVVAIAATSVNPLDPAIAQHGFAAVVAFHIGIVA